MTSKFSYFLKVFEAKAATPSHVPRCTIEFHVRYRYQLWMPSNEGTPVVIEDIVTPEQRTTLRLPIFLPLSTWRQLYLSDVLKPSNLDSNTRDILNPKISGAIASIAERNVHKGFDVVVMVGILKAETMSREEADRIAGRMAEGT